MPDLPPLTRKQLQWALGVSLTAIALLAGELYHKWQDDEIMLKVAQDVAEQKVEGIDRRLANIEGRLDLLIQYQAGRIDRLEKQ